MRSTSWNGTLIRTSTLGKGFMASPMACPPPRLRLCRPAGVPARSYRPCATPATGPSEGIASPTGDGTERGSSRGRRPSHRSLPSGGCGNGLRRRDLLSCATSGLGRRRGGAGRRRGGIGLPPEIEEVEPLERSLQAILLEPLREAAGKGVERRVAFLARQLDAIGERLKHNAKAIVFFEAEQQLHRAPHEGGEADGALRTGQMGRASCRESVGQRGEDPG